MRTFSEQGWAAPGAAQPARSTVTTPGGGLGNSSVPWPGRPLRPVGVGGFGGDELGNMADGERGQILFQLRAGDTGKTRMHNFPRAART